MLAWRLLEKGQRLLVVDRDEPNTSSKVAAGLVTPLAGSRFALSESLATRLDHARGFYWKHEEASGKTFFHHRRIARLFQSETERATWTARLENEGERYTRFYDTLKIDPLRFHAPFGGFEMKEGGWLDVPAFLEHTRQMLLERAAYAIGRVKSEEIVVLDGGIRWKNIHADRVIFCEGWRGNRNHFFDWVPMNGALGDILDLNIPELEDEHRIVSRGGWLLPLGGGRFRVGSNYRHHFSSEAPDEVGRTEILEKLARITPAACDILGHRAAVRPVIRRSQVFMGSHPSHRRIAFFNGLGSKGVLNAPWYAAQLANHLLEGTPLPPDADLANNHF